VRGARLAWLSVRLGVIYELTYRANLMVQVVASSVSLATSLIFLAAIYAHTDALAGWRPAELFALLGVFFVLTGLIGSVVQPSLYALMEDVRLGSLDFTLTKPRDAQLLISIRHVDVWKLVDVGLGLVLLTFSVMQLRESVGLLQAAQFIVALVAGGATIYSLCLMLATLAFWFIRVDNALIIFLAFWEAGRWPVQVYPEWLGRTLTFLVPVAFATTIPAEALSGRLGPETLSGALVLAVGLLVASRLLWLRGLSRYAGASA
jgi:ABC-2 type transport system permease protein